MSTFINNLAEAIHDTQRFTQIIAPLSDYNFTLLDLTMTKLKLESILLSSSVSKNLIIKFCHALNTRFLSLKDEYVTDISHITTVLRHLINKMESTLNTQDIQTKTIVIESEESPSDSDKSNSSSSLTIGVKRKAPLLNFTSVKRPRRDQDFSVPDLNISPQKAAITTKKLAEQKEEQEILEFFEEEKFNLEEIKRLTEKNNAIWTSLAFIKENFSLLVFDFKFTKEQLMSLIIKPGATARLEALRDYYFTFRFLGATNSEIIQIGRYCPEHTLKFLGENFWQFATRGFRPDEIISEIQKTMINSRLEAMLHQELADYSTSAPRFLKSLQLQAYALEHNHSEFILTLPINSPAADFYKINHYLKYLSLEFKEKYQIYTDHFTFKIPQSYLVYLKPYLTNVIEKINLTDLDNILPDISRYFTLNNMPRGLKILCDNKIQAQFTAKRINLIRMAVQCTFVIKFKKNPLSDFTITLDNNSVIIDNRDALITLLEERDSLQKIIDNLESHLYGHLRAEIFSRPTLEQVHRNQIDIHDGYQQNNFFCETSSGKDEAEEYMFSCGAPCL